MICQYQDPFFCFNQPVTYYGEPTNFSNQVQIPVETTPIAHPSAAKTRLPQFPSDRCVEKKVLKNSSGHLDPEGGHRYSTPRNFYIKGPLKRFLLSRKEIESSNHHSSGATKVDWFRWFAFETKLWIFFPTPPFPPKTTHAGRFKNVFETFANLHDFCDTRIFFTALHLKRIFHPQSSTNGMVKWWFPKDISKLPGADFQVNHFRGVQIWNSSSYLWSLRSRGAMLVVIACHGVARIPFRMFASFMNTLPETNIAPENGWLEY